MKKLLLAVLSLAALTTVPATAQQGAPYDKWCRDQPLGRGSVMICSAYTYQQCMASRTSHVETCYLNPRYDPRFDSWRKRNPQY